MIGDEVKYGKVILRNFKCWRCKHRGEYEWRTSQYGQKIPNSKKIYCNKTKRWGSIKRAFFCRHFESNTGEKKEEHPLFYSEKGI